MQLAPLAFDRTPISRVEAKDIDQHIERLMRIKAQCGVLKPGLERRFNAVIAKAHISSTGTDPAARTAALSALSLLSLELCDE